MLLPITQVMKDGRPYRYACRLKIVLSIILCELYELLHSSSPINDVYFLSDYGVISKSSTTIEVIGEH